jgi:2-polyprenyl-3-methyl-5-hydroxy-6-metoxy-1,4-benzoquinol methylase
MNPNVGPLSEEQWRSIYDEEARNTTTEEQRIAFREELRGNSCRASIRGVGGAYFLRPGYNLATKLPNGSRILDVGGGWGLFSLATAFSRPDPEKPGHSLLDVYGLDASLTEISRSQDIENEAKTGAKFTWGTLENCKFPDNHFDLIHASNVMEHVNSVTEFLHKIHCLLKPGGCFVGSVPIEYLACEAFGHRHYFVQKDIWDLRTIDDPPCQARAIENMTYPGTLWNLRDTISLLFEDCKVYPNKPEDPLVTADAKRNVQFGWIAYKAGGSRLV